MCEKQLADKLQQPKKKPKRWLPISFKKDFVAVFIFKKYVHLENKAKAFLAPLMSKWQSPNANFSHGTAFNLYQQSALIPGWDFGTLVR